MKKTLLLIFLSVNCFSQNNINQVINKFKLDNNSFLIYKQLCENKHNNSYNFYIEKYNLKEPFPRLFEYETIEKYIKTYNCSKNSYIKLISDTKNYINDDRINQYLKDYLSTYKISIITD
jgi:hypothetical protein